MGSKTSESSSGDQNEPESGANDERYDVETDPFACPDFQDAIDFYTEEIRLLEASVEEERQAFSK